MKTTSKTRVLGNGIRYESPDWTDFQTFDSLLRKAGTTQDELTRVVIKELTDNALDAAQDADVSLRESTATVTDNGPGIHGSDKQIARLFSLNRPAVSSKFERLPSRGQLGIGLRVAVGAVAATQGQLFISTGGRRLEILPDHTTGKSTAIRVGDYEGEGTRIEITLGSPLEPKPNDLRMAQIAIDVANKQTKWYRGRTSAHWYDSGSFYKLMASVQDPAVTVRAFVARLEGCKNHAAEIATGFDKRPASSVTRAEALRLLGSAQEVSEVVKPQRLGSLGQYAFDGAYARRFCFWSMPPGVDGVSVQIPVVLEAWATPCAEDMQARATLLINSTPAVSDMGAWYEEKEKRTVVYGSDFRVDAKTGKTGMRFYISIITPYMALTSDGKAPAIGMFEDLLRPVIEQAANRAKANQPKDAKIDQKEVVFAHMDEVINIVSDNRRDRFDWRQTFYQLRPIVMEETGRELKLSNFNKILADYIAEHGDEPMSFRYPRGTFRTPHINQSFPLGTIEVEQYARPPWVYNKVLFVEKESYFAALEADGWPERNDCALLSSKGQATCALKDLIDLIGDTDEEVQVFALHDADATGTLIFQALQEETRTRPGRNIKIVNLGLEPWEAVELAEQGIVEIENVTYEKRQPVADYIDEEWAEWLQSHRVELNALTTRQFIDFLDGKLADYQGKLIPPANVLAKRLADRTEQGVREAITKEILAEAKLGDRIKKEVVRLSPKLKRLAVDLADRVEHELQDDPQRHWSNVVDTLADGAVKGTDA
jgi:hypothetical protein